MWRRRAVKRGGSEGIVRGGGDAKKPRSNAFVSHPAARSAPSALRPARLNEYRLSGAPPQFRLQVRGWLARRPLQLVREPLHQQIEDLVPGERESVAGAVEEA